jgi:hypothetical protein
VRITIFSCDSTRAASSLSTQTTRQRADALAVEREALRERGGDEEVQARVQELLDHRAVLGDAVAKALVGHVEEGDQAAAFTTSTT